jgi:hypothetical protein
MFPWATSNDVPSQGKGKLMVVGVTQTEVTVRMLARTYWLSVGLSLSSLLSTAGGDVWSEAAAHKVSARDVFAVPQFPPPDDYLLRTENLDQLAAVFSRTGEQGNVHLAIHFPLYSDTEWSARDASFAAGASRQDALLSVDKSRKCSSRPYPS